MGGKTFVGTGVGFGERVRVCMDRPDPDEPRRAAA
jgi:hypothetical protein